MMAGRILADLGADVLVVEPPGGAPGRRLRPFVENRPGLERSLTWHALNQNKRAITLECSHPDTDEVLAGLIQGVDIVIEWIEASDRSKLSNIDVPEALIHSIVRPFEPGSAKGHYEVTDAVLAASGGAPAMIGTLDHAPLFCPVPQNMMDTGAEAAVASLVGLMGRELTGQSPNPTVLARIASMFPALGRMLRHAPQLGRTKTGGRAFRGLPVVPTTYDCSDGVMVVSVPMAPAFKAMSQNLTAWLVDIDLLPYELGQLDWIETVQEIGRGDKPKSLFETYLHALKQACCERTRMELLEDSRRVGFLASPILTMKDIYEFEHYRERGLFVDTEILNQTTELPYRFAQFDNYEIEIKRSAPKLSQDTFDVLSKDVGLSALEIQALFAHGLI